MTLMHAHTIGIFSRSKPGTFPGVVSEIITTARTLQNNVTKPLYKGSATQYLIFVILEAYLTVAPTFSSFGVNTSSIPYSIESGYKGMPNQGFENYAGDKGEVSTVALEKQPSTSELTEKSRRSHSEIDVRCFICVPSIHCQK